MRKRDGSLRSALTTWKINKVTVKNKYPLPRSDDLSDLLQGATVFTKIDLQFGYHQLRVRGEDVPKTAFQTRCEQLRVYGYAIGLTNAPAAFWNIMNGFFRPHLDQFVVAFIDDVLNYSRTD